MACGGSRCLAAMTRPGTGDIAELKELPHFGHDKATGRSAPTTAAAKVGEMLPRRSKDVTKIEPESPSYVDKRRNIRMRNRMGFWLVAGLALSLLLVSVAGAASRTYLFRQVLGPSIAHSDLVQHNHYYNGILFDTNPNSFPSGLFESTSGSGNHFVMTGNGNLSYSHSATYYDAPYCWNRDSVSHLVASCVANW